MEILCYIMHIICRKIGWIRKEFRCNLIFGETEFRLIELLQSTVVFLYVCVYVGGWVVGWLCKYVSMDGFVHWVILPFITAEISIWIIIYDVLMRSTAIYRLDVDRPVQWSPAQDSWLADPTNVWLIYPLADRQRMYYHVIDLVSIGVKLHEPCLCVCVCACGNAAANKNKKKQEMIRNTIHPMNEIASHPNRKKWCRIITLDYLISVNNNVQHASKAWPMAL